MNKRLRKKQTKQLIRKINKFTLEDNDIVVLHFNKEGIKPSELYEMMEYAHSIFDNIKIVAFPDSISSKKYDKDILIQKLEEVIEILKSK